MTTEQSKIPAVEESVGTVLMRALYDEIVGLRQPWVMTPQQMQQEVLDRLRAQVERAVSVAVTRIATSGFQHVTVQIESLTVKDEAKATLSLSRGTEAVHELADRVGTHAVIVFADPKEYVDGMHAIQSQADQPDLPGV
jgi:hypothetical protein